MAKRKRRNFTPEFKAKVVLEALRGESSQAELCQRHNISKDQLSEWKQQFVENAVSLFESRDKPSKDETERTAELEQLVGRLSVAVDIQKKPALPHRVWHLPPLLLLPEDVLSPAPQAAAAHNV